MREKYLEILLKLVAKMQDDYTNDKLDESGRYLFWSLQKVLVAYWFMQIDDLHSHICQYRLYMTLPVLEDTAAVAQQFIDAYKEEKRLAQEAAERAALGES